MPIERFVWTLHAERRRQLRLLDRAAAERTVRTGHGARRVNSGRADWLTHGLSLDGRRFAVIYDHPHNGDPHTVRIVSLWEL